jgi:excisionase family DNA binding protein
MRALKITDLAASLGVHRVSFARLARTSGIPGLERTAKGRWKVKDRKAFEKFASQYKAKTNARCSRLAGFNGDRERSLKSAIRFHRTRFPFDDRIPVQCEKEIKRLRSPGVRDSYTTTEMARLLRVSSQTVRNWRNRIPGAKFVGQRLRFEKCEKLTEFLKMRCSIRAVQLPRWTRRRRVRRHTDEQATLPFVSSVSESRFKQQTE